MQTSNILIVDDEKSVLESIKRAFMDDPYDVHIAQNAEDGMRLLSAIKMKVVISDEMMPGMSGADFLAKVSSNFPRVIRIMLTGHASLASAVKAINKGEIYRFFTKPWDDFELRFAVKTAIEKFDLEEENSRLLETVKKQALNLKLIEKEFPGITQLEYDANGRILISDFPDEEIDQIVRKLEKEYGS
ncbi:MAG TPA: response regulator [Dissulfurispiraceae bacterium]|nr:response regulator [Dissulfurispiraceae bacterium]